MESLLIPEATCNPHTAYGVSKYAIELLARALGARYGIPTACMRYTYVQGARNSVFNAYSGICRIFALRIANGLPPICYEDGQQRRDYVNVGDVARANVIAMEDTSNVHAVVNVGGGQPITVFEFARLMLQAMGSSVEPEVGRQFRLGDTRHTVSDITPMRSLGWEPTVSVTESIAQYLSWMPILSGSRQYLDDAERAMREQGVVREVGMS